MWIRAAFFNADPFGSGSVWIRIRNTGKTLFFLAKASLVLQEEGGGGAEFLYVPCIVEMRRRPLVLQNSLTQNLFVGVQFSTVKPTYGVPLPTYS